MKKITLFFALLLSIAMTSTISAQTVLTVPTVGTASRATLTGFIANWTAVANASSYSINVYAGASLVTGSPKSVSGATSATIAIAGMLTPNTTYTYTVTAIGDGVTYLNSAASAASATFTTATSTGTFILQYADVDVATLNADLKAGAADIYELTTSGGAYTFSTGATSNNNTLVKNTTIRAAAGLVNKPVLKISNTSTGQTQNIINTATANLTVKFDGLEFTGVNGSTGTSPLAFISTGANTQLYVTNCYFHDFLEAVSGNGTIRFDGVSTTQVMDIQGSTFNHCGGRILYINPATASTTNINVKNCTFSNNVTENGRANVVYNALANPGTQTYDHCIFYTILTSTTSPIYIKALGGAIAIKNCLFSAVQLTQPLTYSTTITDCYVAGFASPPSSTTTPIIIAPIYTNTASLDFSLTNRGSYTSGLTTDGLTPGNTSYYNLAVPTVGTGSAATSGGFTANWTAVANATSYDVYVYQNGVPIGSVRNVTGATTATLPIIGLDASTVYTYSVMAKGDGTSNLNSLMSAQSASISTLAPSGITLATPTASAATGMTTFSFTANWSNTDANASGGYNVKVYNGATLVNTYNATSPSATSLLINTGLTYNTAYTYTVTAVGNGTTYTNSIASNVISVSTNNRTTLTTPTAGTATSIDYTSFTANWSADTNASNFSIKTYCGTNLISTTTALAGTSSVSVTGLLTGIDYTYTVTSNGDGITYLNSGISNSVSIQTLGRVSSIITDFNDNTWGSILSTVPATGTFPSGTINDFTLNAAAFTANSNRGPKGESHTNRISIDKLSVAGSVTLPTISSVGQLEIHFAMGTAANTINLKEYNVATNSWTLVGSYAYDAAYKTANLDQIVIVPFATPHTNAKFKIENNSSGSCYLVQIIARTTNPALLTAPTVGTATNPKATTTIAQWTTPLDVNASNFEVKVYKVITSATTGAKTETTTLRTTALAANGLSTSVNVNGLQADSTYVFKVKAVGDGDINYSDSYQTTSSVQFTLAHQDYYQSLTSGNWGDASTWQSSTDNATWTAAIVAPTSTSVASIQIMNGHTVTIVANATASVLNINSGGQVTLNNGSTLTAATFNINSNAGGTGTYVDNGTTVITGTTNVNQYLTSGRNWYISSPVTSATSNVFSASSSFPMYSYSESTGTAAPWTKITDNLTPLTVTQGYIANIASSGPVTFSGTLNNGSLTPVTLYRTTGQAKEGFNLIGNPYPSYLNWTSVSNANPGLMTTMWYRTKTAPAGDLSTFVYDTYNANGGQHTNLGATTVSNLIPPMQAFWVRVIDGQSQATLSFTNAMRSHADVGTNSFKAPAIRNTDQQVLHLQVSNGINNDETIIYSDANALNTYDTYDSPKLTNNNAAIPEIFTTAEGENLVINGLSSIPVNQELPLGFTTGTANSFTLKATEVTNFDAGTKIILKDNLLNTEQDMTDGSTYSFSSDALTTSTRFSVIFKTSSIATGINSNDSDNSDISVYKNATGQITVNCAYRLVAQGTMLAVFNELGQKLSTNKLTSTITVLNNKYNPGVNIVNVIANGKTTTRKVVIN